MTSSRRHRLLPPRLFMMLALVMIAATFTLRPRPAVISFPWTTAGLFPLVGGAVLCVSNARRFDQERTNIVTFEDPTIMIIDGWFAHSRNPMYLGFVLMLVGLALLLGALIAWVGPVLFFGAAQWWYIPFEEQRMRAQFGAEYQRYAQHVRAWW